jgi:hypothetical protein
VPRMRRWKNWLRQRRRLVAIVSSIALVASGVGFLAGRWSLGDRPAPRVALAASGPPTDTSPTQIETRPAEELALSPEEIKLIAALAQAPANPTDRRRPKLNPQQIGSVGYLGEQPINVIQVLDSSTFSGTTTWHLDQAPGAAKDRPVYLPHRDERYQIVFAGVPTFALHDDQVLMRGQGTDAGIFDKAFVTLQPRRFETAFGPTRAVMAVTAFDDSRVRALTDGKSSEQLTALLETLGAGSKAASP